MAAQRLVWVMTYFATTAVMSISSNIPSIANPLMTRNVFTGMGVPA